MNQDSMGNFKPQIMAIKVFWWVQGVILSFDDRNLDSCKLN